MFLRAIVDETKFVLVFLWSLTLTEGPKIYFRCGRAGCCPDQEVTGRHKSVLVLALGVFYPRPGWLLPPRAARKVKNGFRTIGGGKKVTTTKAKKTACTQKLNNKVLCYF